MIRYCTQCGKEFLPKDSFCRSCGVEVRKSMDNKRFANKANIAKTFGFILLALFVVIIFAVSVFSSPSSIEKNKSHQDSQTILPTVASEIENKNSEADWNQGKLYDLVAIIKQWRPTVAYIECDFFYPGISSSLVWQSGSGILAESYNGDITFLTNNHVVQSKNKYTLNLCSVELPKNDPILVKQENISTHWKYDFTKITTKNSYIKNPDYEIDMPLNEKYIKRPDYRFKNCDAKASIGDSVVILGYPSIGSKNDITATEGIISGYESDYNGSYYITSAKIDQGNSGGAAILLKDNCYLGIPTFVRVGEIESLARILDVKALLSR